MIGARSELAQALLAPDTVEWPVWSTTARIVVTEPSALAAAYDRAGQLIDDVDRAASRFRDDSEIRRLDSAAGRPTKISWLLADLIQVALDAARHTDGDVDPGLGNGMRQVGYDRDFAQLDRDPAAIALRPEPGTSMSADRRGPITVLTHRGWRDILLEEDRITVPTGLSLDLGATAKAFTSDLIARTVAAECEIGVLVSLGGDIATAGPGPDGGWRVLVSDGADQPETSIALPAGSAIATSSTIRRRWAHDGQQLHHILDPRTGAPVTPVWRTVTVAEQSCVMANTLTTAAVVRGPAAPSWLRTQGVPARLVAADGSVTVLGGWPDERG